VQSLLLFLVDITAHVMARRALERHEKERAELLQREREARLEAEAANRTKDEFLATVSHELRTPLNAILGWSRLARADATPDTERALSIIERNATAQARIIEDVLDVSRIISGKLRLDPRPMRLEQAVQGALEAVRPAAEAKQVELAVRVGTLPEIIGDPDRIQQVVWNLLSNAVKFTPRSGKIKLDAEARGDEVVLEVTDSGQGIDPKFLPHVFEPFRQADSSTTRRHGGLGLGLAIVKQLVYAHGGTLRADSEGMGRGATFTVAFPASDDLDSGAFAVANAPARQPRLDDVKVLVVDDEEDARMLLVEILSKQGAATMTAASAREALEELGRFHPDVVVSDIGMPEADGYMLLERIRTLDPGAGGRTPAVALTAYARPEDAARALRAGFQTHLAKPVDAGRLISAIARLSGAPRPAQPPG
jgi:CheY-like chemotaxis protein